MPRPVRPRQPRAKIGERPTKARGPLPAPAGTEPSPRTTDLEAIFAQSAAGQRTPSGGRAPAAGAAPLSAVGENKVIWVKGGRAWPMFAAAIGGPPPRGARAFPFYVYDADGGTRRENITDAALDRFRTHYGDPVISKWSIFDYVYALLHHPGNRQTRAGDRGGASTHIPFAPDFRAFQRAGQRLIELHLNFERVEPHPLTFDEAPGGPRSRGVNEKMRLSKDKARLVVNKGLSLSGIPSKCFECRLANRSALEWVIDRHHAEGAEHAAKLVGRVIAVSLGTVEIVAGLPKTWSDGT